jgi:L-ribulose-5-phosphate 4-epimerase
MLESLRQEIWRLHLELPKNELVSWTTGNLSGRDPGTGLVVIKPSGVRYDNLTPKSLVVVDLQGEIVEGDLAPSVDCASHLHVYRHRRDIHGIAHTHSPYATAFAAAGQSIPAVLTAIADEFGGPIPCSRGYAPVGGEQIGAEILRTLGAGPAVLLKQHGVFTVGSSPEAAVKAAVMTESVAKTVFIARQLGPLEELPATEVERAHQQYVRQYGQRAKR